MSNRRVASRGAILCLAFAALAVWDTSVFAQTSGGASGVVGGTASSGSSSSASTGSTATATPVGFTGGTASGSANSTSPGGFTGGSTLQPISSSSSKGSTTSSQVPTSGNPFFSTYVNPYSAGMVDTTGKATSAKAFGAATYGLYSTAASTGTTTAATSTGFTGSGATQFVTGGVGFGYNTYGQGRTYSYAAVPGDTLPLVVHGDSKLQTNIANMLSRSISFNSPAPLRVQVNKDTVTIAGVVATAKQRRLVEGMIRMTPGVRGVVNNLQVTETLPPPRTGTTASIGR